MNSLLEKLSEGLHSSLESLLAGDVEESVLRESFLEGLLESLALESTSTLLDSLLVSVFEILLPNALLTPPESIILLEIPSPKPLLRFADGLSILCIEGSASRVQWIP